MRFINRESELQTLEKEYRKKGSSFVVIYGRRRTGKTTLIEKFIENKKSIYFLADLQSEKLQLDRFKNIVSDSLKDDLLKSLQINDWETLFKYIFQKEYEEKIIIVIDEFQYLAKVNKAIPSIFQSIWDTVLKNKDVMFIISGSLISLMYDIALNYSSPLYGRRTSQIRLQPMNFFNFKKFFNLNDNDKLLQFYSVIGGIPKYIEFIDENKDIFENIKESILYKNSFLYEEPKFILKDEVRDPVTYFSILQVISQGEHKIGKIASKVGMETKNLTSFIEKLIELEIIKREIPITEENPNKSKKGLYFIKDNFFNFWFRYVFPYQSYLETERYDFVINKIKTEFRHYVSSIFEDVSKDFLIQNLDLPFSIKRIGKWWDKDTEIDVVALGEKEILFGECKYWDSPVGLNVLEDLKVKSEQVGYKEKDEYFAIFSRRGFTQDLINFSKKNKNIFLFSLEEF
ncbi:ATP-binding protein [Sulfurihydrogenibium sp.]|uniref:ATP-binding protein n=1 Tax=Sulfurihydrogenibium sp. TaxID=2053621 RepID=UPI0026187D08|nr:ATP-binding protein [Sulfurihydrogenibium sp.]